MLHRPVFIVLMQWILDYRLHIWSCLIHDGYWDTDRLIIIKTDGIRESSENLFYLLTMDDRCMSGFAMEIIRDEILTIGIKSLDLLCCEISNVCPSLIKEILDIGSITMMDPHPHDCPKWFIFPKILQISRPSSKKLSIRWILSSNSPSERRLSSISMVVGLFLWMTSMALMRPAWSGLMRALILRGPFLIYSLFR